MSLTITYRNFVTLNRTAIKNSTECGCVYCMETFDPLQVIEWCSDYDEVKQQFCEDTALCPKCGIDSVVPNYLIKYTKDDLIRWRIQGFGYV